MLILRVLALLAKVDDHAARLVAINTVTTRRAGTTTGLLGAPMPLNCINPYGTFMVDMQQRLRLALAT